MKPRYLLLSAALAVSISGLSMTWVSDEYRILTEEDYSIVERQRSPALQTAIGEEPHLESFNEWRCFPNLGVEIDCFEDKTGRPAREIDPEEREDNGYYPDLAIEKDGHAYFFEGAEMLDFDACQTEISKWRNLIAGQAGLCVFAAAWPPHPQEAQDQYSNWVLYGLKTPAGRVLAPIYDPEAPEDSD